VSMQTDFIASVLPGAMTIQARTGIPAAVMIAQAIQETGWGKYVTKDAKTGRNSFNLFNIKGSGPAGYVTARTWEVYGGETVKINANFRAYHNYEESFDDYAKLIAGTKRYAPAMAVKHDPEEFARAIHRCGYATDPNYSKTLISIMRTWNLIERTRGVEEVPEWMQRIMEEAKMFGLITSDHNPNEPATKWFVLAVALNVIKAIRGGK
jgi:flagellum-specific peptidoglycan hydrolase FlgJ